MNYTPPADDSEVFGLIHSLEREWIKLPLVVMRDVGPAAQTLGGFLKVTNTETFAPISAIAEHARLPIKTARNHLKTLTERGWIQNAGRQHTRRGVPRRTCTLRLTSRAREVLKANKSGGPHYYGVLPEWACYYGCKYELRWSTKAVLSVVIARLMGLKSKIEKKGGPSSIGACSFWAAIEVFGGAERFRFTLNRLQAVTGLSLHSVISAKKELLAHGIITGLAVQPLYRGDSRGCLMPNPAFRIVVSRTSLFSTSVEFRTN